LTGDLLLAFSAGAVSFFAPCVVPLLPAYVSYLGGAGLPEIQRDSAAFQSRILRGGALYVLGFGLIFILLGVGAGVVGHNVLAGRAVLQRIGGVLVVLMGLALLDWLPGRLGQRTFALLGSRTEHVRAAALDSGRHSVLGPFLLGLVFGTAWTPCVGPVLGSILVLASTRQQALEGGLLLASYTLGLGLPFILFSLLVAGFPALVRPLSRFSSILSRAAGALMIILGLLLISGVYQSLAGYLAQPLTLR
jgi:cytochrome c-type biogenesis protein